MHPLRREGKPCVEAMCGQCRDGRRDAVGMYHLMYDVGEIVVGEVAL